MSKTFATTNHHSQTTKIWKPLFAVVVWGFSFIATKHALNELSPVTIVFIRQLLGIVFLGMVAKRQKHSFSVKGKDLYWIIILAAVASVHLWIQVTGLQWTSASNTGWIIGTTPVFMVMLSLVFFKEKISGMQWLGILISFIGLIILVSQGDLSSLDFITNKGDVLIILSSVTWAIYSLVNKKITFHYSPVMTTFYLFVFVSVMLLPFAVNKENINSVLELSSSGWISVLFLGVVCSGAAYALWAQALSEMSASKVGAFLYIEPFVTFFGAWLLLGEHVTILTLVSGFVIIAGVFLVNRK
jgi:drug/metabolite transporter (DMT)-like permease